MIDRKTLLAASKDELIKLAEDLARLRAQTTTRGPRNPEELHAYIKEKWGLHIPRVAVEPGHTAPFEVICDIFFEREDAIVVVGGRNTSKTWNVAIAQILNARFKPGYWGITAGAIGEQSKSAYEAITNLISSFGSGAASTETEGEDDIGVKDTLQSRTTFSNKSKVDVKIGTPQQMNGPHSNLLHRDENEMWDPEGYNESENITRTGKTTDGRVIKAINVDTSSLKFANGRLQAMMKTHDDAIKAGRKPPFKLIKFGIAETIENQPNCRMAPENQGKPETELCDCHTIFKGKMPKKDIDDKPIDRSLDLICNGRFYKSDGFRPMGDVRKQFTTNSPAMWESQHECRRAAAEGLVLKNFSRGTHCIQEWPLDMTHGEVVMGIDFGATDPNVMLLAQYTNQPLLTVGFNGYPVVIPAKSYVIFDEVYFAEGGVNQLGQRIGARLAFWSSICPGFTVSDIYADLAAKSQRIDLRQTYGLRSIWRLPNRDRSPRIEKVEEAVDAERFFVVFQDEELGHEPWLTSCDMTVAEAEVWQRDPKDLDKTIDGFDHCMDTLMFIIPNHERKLQISGGNSGGESSMPASAVSIPVAVSAASALKDMPSTGPAAAGYMRSDPHEDEVLPIHQGAMSALQTMMP